MEFRAEVAGRTGPDPTRAIPVLRLVAHGHRGSASAHPSRGSPLPRADWRRRRGRVASLRDRIAAQGPRWSAEACDRIRRRGPGHEERARGRRMGRLESESTGARLELWNSRSVNLMRERLIRERRIPVPGFPIPDHGFPARGPPDLALEALRAKLVLAAQPCRSASAPLFMEPSMHGPNRTGTGTRVTSTTVDVRLLRDRLASQRPRSSPRIDHRNWRHATALPRCISARARHEEPQRRGALV